MSMEGGNMLADTSILISTKKYLGLVETYTIFDDELITLINGVFAQLYTLGVGPSEPFEISSEGELWSSFLGTNTHINEVSLYVFLNVQLLFDPPSSSYVLTAKQAQISKLEYELYLTCDPDVPVPTTTSYPEDI